MTHPVRIAVQLHPQHAEYRQIRDAVHRAEDIGVDIVFNWDHFYPLYGEPDGKHFECWSMLAARRTGPNGWSRTANSSWTAPASSS